MKNLDLKFALENGIIDETHVAEQIEMSKKERILRQHEYNIWQGSNGMWYTHLPDTTKGRIQKCSKTKEGLENKIVEHYKMLQTSPTINELHGRRLERRLKNGQISKATYYRYNMNYKKHFSEFGTQKWCDVGMEDWCDLLESEIARCNLTRKGFDNLKTTVSGIFKQAKREKLATFTFNEMYSEIEEDLSFTKKIIRDCDEVYDEIETDKIVKYLTNNLDARNLVLLVLFISGARIGEIVSLKNDDIERKSFYVCRTETSFIENHKRIYGTKEYPKTENGVRNVVVPKQYEWVLLKCKALNPFGEYTFIEKGKVLNSEQVRQRLRVVCENLDIPYRPPHKIRKTYITILLDSMIDKNLITNQVGHSDIVISETHYHRNRKTIDKKQQILDTIAEFV